MLSGERYQASGRVSQAMAVRANWHRLANFQAAVDLAMQSFMRLDALICQSARLPSQPPPPNHRATHPRRPRLAYDMAGRYASPSTDQTDAGMLTDSPLPRQQ